MVAKVFVHITQTVTPMLDIWKQENIPHTTVQCHSRFCLPWLTIRQMAGRKQCFEGLKIAAYCAFEWVIKLETLKNETSTYVGIEWCKHVFFFFWHSQTTPSSTGFSLFILCCMISFLDLLEAFNLCLSTPSSEVQGWLSARPSLNGYTLRVCGSLENTSDMCFTVLHWHLSESWTKICRDWGGVWVNKNAIHLFLSTKELGYG